MDASIRAELASRPAVDVTLGLAARLKVAAVLTCAPELLAGTDTWRDLIDRVTTPQGRAQAEEAWRAVADLQYVDADRVRGYLLTAVLRLAESPDEPHHARSLLDPAEVEELTRVAAGPVRPLPDRRFHELFEDRVRRHPDAVAAVQGARSWTYTEVNRNANRIAWALRDGGLAAEDVVAVVTERTLEWLAAVIGVLKAGGCYLPLEPHFPAGRIGAVLDRSGCRRVLAEPGAAGLAEALAGRPGVELLPLGDLLAGDGPTGDVGVPVSADQLAYIYFTSGSTGEPKGAMCEHAGFLNHLLAKIEDMGVVEGTVLAQTAPQCFDISLWQLVAALLVGGRTLIVEQDVLLDVRRFIGLLDEQRVEVAQLVPTYLDVFLATMAEAPRPLPALRTMAVTGEPLKKELVRRWFAVFPDTPLVDCYGTTESSDDTNHAVMRGVPEEPSVPLGTVIRNIRVYLVDDHLHLVPRGAQGEIVFAGVCVGRGYVNDPERTRAAYLVDPLRPADRLYRSGDFGRLLPSGRLEYLGRRDSQVKVSGFRIEIGEIENRLLQVPGVRDGAVVLACGAGEPQLVAYYAGGQAPDPEQAAQALGRSLPTYMVPRRLYRLDRLPLSGNGKIDRRELTRRAETDGPVDGHRPPATETERHLARLWSELLKVPADRIGRDTPFVEIGGTSLAAIRLSISLDRIVSVADLWRTSTLAEVAELIDRKRAQHAPARGAEPAASLPVWEVRSAGDAVAWATEHRGAVRARVERDGAVLLRGLGVDTTAETGRVAAALGIAAMAERERFAPRTAYPDGVYSSSHWPSDEPMCMHHELSYAAEIPGTLLFACLAAPATGGRTALADSQAVLRALPRDLVAPFERDGWLLTRMYHEVGVPWQDAFGTTDTGAVDEYCRAAGLACEWLPDGRLRTRQRRSAVLRHPRTGTPGWFNQIAFLNALTMDPEIRAYLVDLYGPGGLPFDTAYGDGSPIPAETVEKINEVYQNHTFGDPWQAGDVLVVDNARMAHSREVYDGSREVAVVLGDPFRPAGHVLPAAVEESA